MLMSLATAALATLLTIADRGLVFQPSLAPDGSRVAYAAELPDGQVGLLVQDVPPKGEAVVVARFGRGAAARRAATLSLAADPWSPDGQRVLFLREQDGTAERSVLLYVADPTGKNAPERIGPEGGIVECAAWIMLDGLEMIVFAHRAAGAEEPTSVQIFDLFDRTMKSEHTFEDATRVSELAVSRSGDHVALVTLEGAAGEQVRKLRVLRLNSEDEPAAIALPAGARPSLPRFAGDQDLLFFVDAASSVLRAWSVPESSTKAQIADAAYALPLGNGAFVAVRGSSGALEIVEVGGNQRVTAAKGLVALSSAGGRLALLRVDELGAAIAVVDGLTDDDLRAGSLGLPPR